LEWSRSLQPQPHAGESTGEGRLETLCRAVLQQLQVVLSPCPGLPTATNRLGVQLPNTLYPPPTPTGSCPSPAVGSSACPACGDTISGATLAASSPYAEKSLLSASLDF